MVIKELPMLKIREVFCDGTFIISLHWFSLLNVHSLNYKRKGTMPIKPNILIVKFNIYFSLLITHLHFSKLFTFRLC